METIRADSLQAALREVRTRFGEDAVVLHTRTVEERGWLGLRPRKRVEIVAARGDGLPSPGRLSIVKPVTEDRERNLPADGAARMVALPSARRQPAARPSPGATGESADAAIPAPLVDFYRRLLANQVADELAEELISRLYLQLGEEGCRDGQAVRTHLVSLLEELLPVGDADLLDGSPAPRVIALVGPTGVGKTTCAAKLASELHLRRHLPVRLVSADNVRPGAAEPLRIYARTLGIAFDVVRGPADLHRVLAAASEDETIILDTAGCNPNDPAAVAQVGELLRGRPGLRVYAVLAAVASERSCADALAAFSAIGAKDVILGKLDEALGFGVVVQCLQKTNACLSLLSAGPRIEDDLAPAHGRLLAEALVGAGADSRGDCR
jgi:flagellar biosynthesis protein FlhF